MRSRAGRGYNLGVVSGEQDGDEGGRTRPVVLTPQAKAVLAVWCGVTLVLVATYAIVLLLL